jgi:uncharacterized protein involved in exopolysaccharide biosynthesis
MSAPIEDPGAEREVDLRRWVDALLSRWWYAAAGLVAGVVVGGLYSLSGGSTYDASALIARGQAFNPSGTTAVLSYLSSPEAIQSYATSPAAVAYAAGKAGMSPSELRGHIATSTLGTTGTASQQNTNSVLVQITVHLNRAKRAEDAANALATYIKNVTTSRYVTQSLHQYTVKLDNYDARIKTLLPKIAALNQELSTDKSLSLTERLLLLTELDSSQATLGTTQDSQTTVQQELILAQDVEQSQIVQKATAEKSTARSRRNSVLFGALIGLVAGAIAAAFAGLRTKPAAATA